MRGDCVNFNTILAKREIRLTSITQVDVVVFWAGEMCGGITSMIAQFAIDVPEYPKHYWVEQGCLAVALALFREAE